MDRARVALTHRTKQDLPDRNLLANNFLFMQPHAASTPVEHVQQLYSSSLVNVARVVTTKEGEGLPGHLCANDAGNAAVGATGTSTHMAVSAIAACRLCGLATSWQQYCCVAVCAVCKQYRHREATEGCDRCVDGCGCGRVGLPMLEFAELSAGANVPALIGRVVQNQAAIVAAAWSRQRQQQAM